MNDEWYTPEYIVEAARRTMGSITTDPASCDLANKVVKAQIFHSKENDGLTMSWDGSVFLNPPYSRGLCAKFIDRLISLNNNLDNPFCEAVVLVNSATSTEWYHRLLWECKSVCLLRRRVRFYRPDGYAPNSPRYDQSVFYIGPRDHDKFWVNFSEFGHVVKL